MTAPKKRRHKAKRRRRFVRATRWNTRRQRVLCAVCGRRTLAESEYDPDLEGFC